MFINIDKDFDVILTTTPVNEVTGHIFECFDYYLFLKKYFKVGILFFNGISYDKLKDLFNFKYNVDFSTVENDIIYYNIDNVVEQKFFIFNQRTKVLLVDGNIAELDIYNICLMTSKLYGFLCEVSEIHTNNPKHNNITYLCDYRIYQKSSKTIDYVKKLPFDFYKKSNRKFDNTGFMYMTYMCRKVSPDIIDLYHKKSKCNKSILVVPYKLPEYDSIKNVTQIVAPVKDLFDKFDTYIYTPVKRKFDCSSRLITECFINNKKVFIDLDYVDVALSVRYNDCLNNLQSLNLTDNDKILEILS